MSFLTLRCVLSLDLTEITSNSWLLCSGATDGRVALWSVAADGPAVAVVSQPIHSLRVHQSGVNAIATRVEANGTRLVLATGGDDNGLSVVVLGLAVGPGCWAAVEICRVSYPSAHASSVTGLYVQLTLAHLIGVHFISGQRLLTFAADCRGNIWALEHVCSRLSGRSTVQSAATVALVPRSSTPLQVGDVHASDAIETQ
jgi:hypothetical protein